MNIAVRPVILLPSKNLVVAQEDIASLKILCTSAIMVTVQNARLSLESRITATNMSVRPNGKLVPKDFYTGNVLEQLIYYLIVLKSLVTMKTGRTWLRVVFSLKNCSTVVTMALEQKVKLVWGLFLELRYMAVQQGIVGFPLKNRGTAMIMATAEQGFGLALKLLYTFMNKAAEQSFGLSLKNRKIPMNTAAQRDCRLALENPNTSRNKVVCVKSTVFKKCHDLELLPEVSVQHMPLQKLIVSKVIQQKVVGFSLKNLNTAMTMATQHRVRLPLENLNTSRNMLELDARLVLIDFRTEANILAQGVKLALENRITSNMAALADTWTSNEIISRCHEIEPNFSDAETNNLSTPLRTKHVKMLYPEDLNQPKEYALELPCSRSVKIWSYYCHTFGHSIVCPYGDNCLFQNYDLCASCNLYCLPMDSIEERENQMNECLLRQSKRDEWTCHLCYKTGPHADFNNSDFPGCRRVFCSSCAEVCMEEISDDKIGFTSSETTYRDYMFEELETENSLLAECNSIQQNTESIWTKILGYDKFPMLLPSLSQSWEVNESKTLF